MSHIITAAISLLVGFVSGLLVYRKHTASLKAKEAELKAKAEAIKSAVKG
ncbi:MAG: hypothetical protein ABFD96_03060 [Armatimonadia bacterium]